MARVWNVQQVLLNASSSSVAYTTDNKSMLTALGYQLLVQGRCMEEASMHAEFSLFVERGWWWITRVVLMGSHGRLELKCITVLDVIIPNTICSVSLSCTPGGDLSVNSVNLDDKSVSGLRKRFSFSDAWWTEMQMWWGAAPWRESRDQPFVSVLGKGVLGSCVCSLMAYFSQNGDCFTSVNMCRTASILMHIAYLPHSTMCTASATVHTTLTFGYYIRRVAFNSIFARSSSEGSFVNTLNDNVEARTSRQLIRVSPVSSDVHTPPTHIQDARRLVCRADLV